MTPTHEAAYRSTIYWIEAPDAWIALEVGVPSAALDRLLTSSGAACWALVTSDNPASDPRSPAENARRRALLEAELAGDHLQAIGIGQGAGWPPELGFFVLRLGREEAIALGRRHGQNAILVGAVGGAPELLACAPTGDSTR